MKYMLTLKSILLVTIIGCHSTACRNEKFNLPVITPANLTGEISLADFSEDISYVQLDNALHLSNILDVKKAKAGFYIKTMEGLFHFNNYGEYQYQIGKKGNGPDEYLFVEDFTIDEKSQQIFILNRTSVKVYDFSGELIQTFHTPDKNDFYEIEMYEDKLIFPKGFGFMPLEKEWIMTDLQGKLVSQKLNYMKTDEIRVEYKANLCFESDNKIYYWNQLNDTIFQVGINPGAAFLFAKDNFRVSEHNFASDENFRKKESWQLISVLGTNRYLFFDYLLMKDMKMNHTVYDKKEMIFFMYSQKKLGEILMKSNTIDNGPAIIPKSKFINNNKNHILTWVDAYRLKLHVASDSFKNSTPKYPEKKKKLEQLANSLDENDNPVLMIVKLKD